ncbi:MAG: type 1 fimbrial protein [Neisseriaceae bacterium]|nr:type 1 fimbrial protein [Neisseriaceae bacterium]
MKLSQLALGLVLASAAGVSMAATAGVDSGTITITGKVTASTCKVTNSENGNLSVVLPTVGVDALSVAGKEAGKRQFKVELKGCKDEKVALSFSADSARGAQLLNNGILKNQAADGSAAQNVGIALYDEQAGGKRIALASNAQNNTTFVTPAKDNEVTALYYSAGYYATGAASAGDVLAIATYEITYE